MASLLPVEIKFKMIPCSGIIGCNVLAIDKILRYSKLDSLEAEGNHLADISARNADLKGTESRQTSVMVQRDISPNDNIAKLAREAQQLASEKRKQD